MRLSSWPICVCKKPNFQSMALRIFHTADLHGTNQVYEALQGQVDHGTDLLLDAGDTLKGSNTAFHWHEPNLDHMSSLQFDAMAMGNRELHYLPMVLKRRAGQRSFPLLAANLVDLWGRERTWQEGLTLEREGLKIGVFGMTVVQYPVGSFYERIFGLRFLAPETIMENLVRRYQQEHDVVIFLSHLGVEVDRRLAQQVASRPELKLDLILGGHSHVFFSEPERFGDILLSHIGSHSRGYSCWERTGDGSWEQTFTPVREIA